MGKNHKNLLRCFAVLLGIAFLIGSTIFSQETRGTIAGRVTDPSGGVIPGVSITVANVETNVSNNALTNDSGLFEVPFLMPGQYTVTAELSGFKRYFRQGIALNVGSKVSLDITLEVGEVSESVTVTAQEPLLDTTSASIGQVMDNRRIMELPVLGNNVMLMAGLGLGMQRPGGYNYLGLHSTIGASDYRTAGGVGGNEWTLDGTPNTGHTRRAAYLPYTDAVDEVRVESTSFDARVGHTTGAFVAMQSKAGTNQYHGTATWSHWQQRWNATPSNDNAAYWSKIRQAEAAGDTALAQQLRKEPRQPSGRSNNYAASIGGPVRIPKLYDGTDKLFFFFIFSGFKDNKTEEPGNKLFTVPTADERRGDFSRLLKINPARYQIYDPLTTTFDAATGLFVRQPFPGNIIPANRVLNPMYKFYEKLYPLPNNPPQMDAEGNRNYFNGAIPFNWDYKAFQNRVDYVPSEQDRFFFRWSYNKFLEDRNDWTFSTARFLHSNGLNRINKGTGFDYVRNFNPTTILNIAIAYNRYFDDGINQEQLKFKPSDVGLPKYLDEKAGDNHILPTINFSNYRQVSGGVNVLHPISVATLKADVTKYLGKHGLTAGWDGRMYYRVTGSPGNTSGRFEFRNSLFRKTSATTGVGTLGIEWAAFMLGIPSSMSADTNDSSYITTPYQAVYLQDNFRVSSKLTLNLGLRMEYEGSIRERFDRGLRDFNFDAEIPFAAAIQAAYAKNPLPERSVSDFVIRGGTNYLGVGVPRTRTDPTYRWLPRFGLAYSWNRGTVIRGGYGVYYDTLNVSHTTIDQSGYSRGTGTTITNDQGVTWNFGYFTTNNPPTTDPFPVRDDGTRFNVPLGNKLGTNSFLGRGFSFLNPNYQPLRQQRWSIEIERQIRGNAVFAIAYAGSWVGNLGVDKNLRPLPEKYWASGLVRNEAISNDLNRSVTNPFFIGNLPELQKQDPLLYQQLSTLGFFTSRTISKNQLLRAFPHMTGLTMQATPIGKNKYHAMQVRFDKRFSRGWTFNTHYEYSHTMSKDWFPNEFDPLPDWRESDNSRPHRWVATSIWELPFGKGKWLLNDKGMLSSVLGGWQLGAIWQMQSGECIDFGNAFYYGKSLRDVVLPDSQRSKDRWFNTDLFERNSTKTAASFHRRVFPNRLNWLRNANLYQLDMNMQRTIPITEVLKALFRVDLINAPNHQVLDDPNTDPTSASFGKINSYLNTPRYIQFQLRLVF
jgi:hypothetical protein